MLISSLQARPGPRVLPENWAGQQLLAHPLPLWQLQTKLQTTQQVPLIMLKLPAASSSDCGGHKWWGRGVREAIDWKLIEEGERMQFISECSNCVREGFVGNRGNTIIYFGVSAVAKQFLQKWKMWEKALIQHFPVNFFNKNKFPTLPREGAS